MTIDVQPGDTFTIAPHGAVFQYRDECGRILGGKNFDFECTRSQHERQITLAQFKTVVELAGHTVTGACMACRADDALAENARLLSELAAVTRERDRCQREAIASRRMRRLFHVPTCRCRGDCDGECGDQHREAMKEYDAARAANEAARGMKEGTKS